MSASPSSEDHSARASVDPPRAFDWLFPEGDPVRSQVGRATTLARQMCLEEVRGEEVSPKDWSRDLQGDARIRSGGALEDLLVHHLLTIHGGRSFMPLPRARLGVQAAWDVLAMNRDGGCDLPGVPEPGESPLAVAARLLQGLYRLEWAEPQLELWRGRFAHASRGARSAEAIFAGALDGEAAERLELRERAAFLAGLLACLLDRGRVDQARGVLGSIDGDRKLRGEARLLAARVWVEIASGDLKAARGLLIESRKAGARCTLQAEAMPRAAIELLDAWPQARELFVDANGWDASSVTPASWGGVPAWWPPGKEEGLGGRESLGAQALLIFALGRDQRVQLMGQELASGLTPRLSAWLQSRADICRRPERAEHQLLMRAQRMRWQAGELPFPLSRHSKALALEPILDADREVAGWVHLEWDHHLIPDSQALAKVANSWSHRMCTDPALQARGSRGNGAVPRAGRRSEYQPSWSLWDRVSESRASMSGWGRRDANARLEERLAEPARGLAKPVFARVIDELRLKLAQRRWWAFAHSQGELRFVDTGGEGLADLHESPGSGRALDRCLATQAILRFDESDPRLSLHGRSASGLVIPFCWAGRVVGLLQIESSRRRDFRGGDLRDLDRLSESHGLALELAAFRAWYFGRFGCDLHFEVEDPGLRDLARDLDAAANSRAPVVLRGPCGVGKSVVARWIHWMRWRDVEVLDEFDTGQDTDRFAGAGQFLEHLARARGTFVLRSPGKLEREHQEALVKVLARRGGTPLSTAGLAGSSPSNGKDLILIDTVDEASGAGASSLRSDLASLLERYTILLAPLQERRTLLSGWVLHFVERFSKEEQRPTPTIGDEALAALWRQSWSGNLRELSNFLFKLVLLNRRPAIDLDQVRSVAKRFRFEWLNKIPPRGAVAKDVEQALQSTRKQSGAFNKRRAALYLGWDPDTLTSRMREFGLERSEGKEES